MIEIRLALTKETTVQDLHKFTELAWKHGKQDDRIVEFDENGNIIGLIFGPELNTPISITNEPVYRNSPMPGGRPIDTL